MAKSAAYILVILQFAAIVWLIKLAYPFYFDIIPLILCAIAISLVIWAVWIMRKSKIRVLPMPHFAADLVTNGPYRFIRHPMYTAVLLFSAGISLDHFQWYKLVIWLVLLIVLLIKLHWEEKLLSKKFPAYGVYQQQTKKLIPFLY